MSLKFRSPKVAGLSTFALAACLALAGCDSPASKYTPEPLPPDVEADTSVNIAKQKMELAGQVFVVTKGHETVKLSLAKVRIFPSSYAIPYHLPILTYQTDLLGWAIHSRSYSSSETFSLGVDDAKRKGWEAWQKLRPAAAEATCDADGRFTISGELPVDYCIVAQSSRRVFDGTEYYTWVIISNKVGDPQKIFLTNENME